MVVLLNYLFQKSFQHLLPSMINVIGQCVEASNEQGARQLFDVLETLLILVSPFLSLSSEPIELTNCPGNTSPQPTYSSTCGIPTDLRWQPQLRRRVANLVSQCSQLDCAIVCSPNLSLSIAR